MKKVLVISFLIWSLGLFAQDNTSAYFQPTPGQYVISGWVKEEHTSPQVTYASSHIEITYGTEVSESFSALGPIIDGWQRVQGTFTVPEDATVLTIKLKATNTSVVAYFDDIRVFPFNGNMKSFVYDPITQRLVAELDENNYATFYEYDYEGGLIRVKKETERGVKTIQETRSGNSKGF
ncbi:hypothetical protein [Dokdonia sp.]|uniref:hypothetical protein n=1 Tax=Dokdonia sp. TaxID=2024995 RepID=UPI0032654EE6